MNTKQKALTLLALLAFILWILIEPFFVHHQKLVDIGGGRFQYYEQGPRNSLLLWTTQQGFSLQPDGVKIVTLAVIYTSLFFVLRTERKP